MMANVNMALEEIITSQKKPRGGAGPRSRGNPPRRSAGGGGSSSGGGGGFRSAGGRGRLFSRDTPDGKWKHDKFAEINGGGGGSSGRSRRSGASGGAAVVRSSRPRGGATGKIVKLNISNLPETVLTADLEELFQDFGVYGVTVHYDESGQHLGTADLFVDFLSAKDIVREYANIAIDGQEIRIAVVDESTGALKPRIQERIRRVASNPIRNRKAQVQRRSSPPGKRSGGGGGGGGVARRAGGAKPKPLSAEDLDKELEAYMGRT